MIDDMLTITQIRKHVAKSHDTPVDPGDHIIDDTITPVGKALMEFTWAGGFIEGCMFSGRISESVRAQLTEERSQVLKTDLKNGGLK